MGRREVTPRHVPWHLPMPALGASQAPTLSTAAIKSTVANFSDFGPDLRNLETEFRLRFLWWREATTAA